MKWRPSANLVTLGSTIVVCALLYAAAAWKFGESFNSLYAVTNLLRDNAYLGIAAVGLTFVILSGGIDLSVGAMVALTSITLAVLTSEIQMGDGRLGHYAWRLGLAVVRGSDTFSWAGHHLQGDGATLMWTGIHPAVAVPLVLLIGATIGTLMGFLIHAFRLAPFFVTLAGMFFARGCALLVSSQSIGLSHAAFQKTADWHISLHDAGDNILPFEAIVLLAVALLGMFLGRQTRFGRAAYAIGGNEQSAVLMGVPVARWKVLTYTFSGFCSALAGVIWAVAGSSGNALGASGMELDAIAAVVVGGTLLSGGVGSVLGTLVGVIICSIIGSVIILASLSPSWNKIAVGGLLLLFIVLQKLLTRVGAVRAE